MLVTDEEQSGYVCARILILCACIEVCIKYVRLRLNFALHYFPHSYICVVRNCAHIVGGSSLNTVGIGFNGAETNCGIAYILGILLMNSCNTVIFVATTIICSLSTLRC